MDILYTPRVNRYSAYMPTGKNIELLQSIAERHSESIFATVHELVKGIARQNVWKNTVGDLVYTPDIDFETIYSTVLEIYMGDYALFCLEAGPDGADAQESESFDTCAHKTIQMIKQILPLFEHDYGPLCRQLRKFMQEEMKNYWNA